MAAHQDAAGNGIMRPTVLAIEDNEGSRVLIQHALERKGCCRLVSVGTGTIGLQAARELQPAVILLDMHLPDISGTEVLRRLRADEATRAIPVVVVSANAIPQIMRRTLDEGAVAYITKPYSIADLVGRVARLVEEREA